MGWSGYEPTFPDFCTVVFLPSRTAACLQKRHLMLDELLRGELLVFKNVKYTDR